MSLRALQGVGEIADAFDGFILDLWGLIHDGERAYAPAPDTLRRLKQAGKRTLLLSNAPRRAHALIAAMKAMGIDRDLYGEVLSSGEATRAALIDRSDPFFAALGPRAYHLGPDRDRTVFEDTGCAVVADLRDADFVMNTGPTELDHDVAHYENTLVAARALDLPMVCANPDHVVIRGGREIVCAGAFAALYEAMGGSVAYRGKPDPAIYDEALKRLGLADKSRVAVVGDALETDVKGGATAGLAAIWCTGGIHAETLGVRYGVAADPAKAQKLADDYGQKPQFSIPGFIW